MIVRCFIDTNILLYAGSRAKADADKARIAAEVLRREPFGLSSQVLQEFVVNALRKPELGYRKVEIDRTLDALHAFPTVPTTPSLIRAAWLLRDRHQLSYWDAAILAAAQTLQCEILYSEDFNSGQSYDGVVATNPFA